MAKVHGRASVVKLDDLGGALIDISTFLDGVPQFQRTVGRDETQSFGDEAKRRGVVGLRSASLGIQGFLQATSGTKLHGRASRVLLDEYSLINYLDQMTVRRSVDLPPTQTFGDAWVEHGITGLYDGAISGSGFYDPAAGEINDILEAIDAAAATSLWDVAPNGFVIGQPVDMARGGLGNWDVPTDENQPTRTTFDVALDSRVDVGVSLHDLSAETAVASFTGVDEAAATALGGVGHIHVTAFSGTNATVLIQDSVDDTDINYGTLITFASITGVGKERVELGSTAAVKRFVRARISVDNFTSMTFVVTFARRGYTSATLAPAGTHRFFGGLVGAAAGSFEYGPGGSTSGLAKILGECRASTYEVTYDENSPTRFKVDIVSDGALTETNW